MFETLGPGYYNGAFLGMIIALYVIFIGFTYVFMALAMQKVAKRLRYKKPWLAWIPIANMWLLPALAKMHWWPILLFFGGLIIYFVTILGSVFFMFASQPSVASIVLFMLGIIVYIIALIVFAVFSIVWQWKICERLKRPGWWAILLIIPFFGMIWMYVMWGMLAWGKA